MRGRLAPLVEDTCSHETVARRGLLDPDLVAQARKQHGRAGSGHAYPEPVDADDSRALVSGGARQISTAGGQESCGRSLSGPVYDDVERAAKHERGGW